MKKNKNKDILNEIVHESVEDFIVNESFGDIVNGTKEYLRIVRNKRRLGKDIRAIEKALETFKNLRSVYGKRVSEKISPRLEYALEYLNDYYKYGELRTHKQNNQQPTMGLSQQPNQSSGYRYNYNTQQQTQHTPQEPTNTPQEQNVNQEKLEDIYTALKQLGIDTRGNQIKNYINSLMQNDPDISEQEVIKKILQSRLT